MDENYSNRYFYYNLDLIVVGDNGVNKDCCYYYNSMINDYYDLNTMFNNKAFLAEENIQIKTLKIGFMFYIL